MFYLFKKNEKKQIYKLTVIKINSLNTKIKDQDFVYLIFIDLAKMTGI